MELQCKFFGTQEPCPFLPSPPLMGALSPSLQAVANPRQAYEGWLARAQDYWLRRKPAQAILMINHALAQVSIAEERPYRALAWLLCHAASGNAGFLGNPVRHYQHLASRLKRGLNVAERRRRAWRCFWLARQLLDSARFPLDGLQLARDGIFVPSYASVLPQIETDAPCSMKRRHGGSLQHGLNAPASLPTFKAP